MSRPIDPYVAVLFDQMGRQGVTVNALAEKSKVARTTILNWKHGRSNPRVPDMDKALRAVGFRFAVVRL